MPSILDFVDAVTFPFAFFSIAPIQLSPVSLSHKRRGARGSPGTPLPAFRLQDGVRFTHSKSRILTKVGCQRPGAGRRTSMCLAPQVLRCVRVFGSVNAERHRTPQDRHTTVDLGRLPLQRGVPVVCFSSKHYIVFSTRTVPLRRYASMSPAATKRPQVLYVKCTSMCCQLSFPSSR